MFVVVRHYGLNDDEAVASGFDDFERNSLSVVYAEYPFDLGQKSGQEPKIAAGDTNESCNDFWGEGSFGQVDADGGPAVVLS